MEEFTKKIVVPLTKLDHTEFGRSDDIKNQEISNAYKQLIKMLIFEIVHEKAWPITAKSISRCIGILYDTFPIESLCINTDSSGVKITVKNEMFDDPTTLSNLRGKVRHGFYDNVTQPNNKIIDAKYRTSKHIAKASEILLKLLDINNSLSYDDLLRLTIDTTNAGEFSQVSSISIDDNIDDITIDENDGFSKKIKDNDIYDPAKMKELFDDLTFNSSNLPTIAVAKK